MYYFQIFYNIVVMMNCSKFMPFSRWWHDASNGVLRPRNYVSCIPSAFVNVMATSTSRHFCYSMLKASVFQFEQTQVFDKMNCILNQIWYGNEKKSDSALQRTVCTNNWASHEVQRWITCWRRLIVAIHKEPIVQWRWKPKQNHWFAQNTKDVWSLLMAVKRGNPICASL